MEIVFPASALDAPDLRSRIEVRASPLHEAAVALHALSRPSQHGALLPWALASRQELGAAGVRALQELTPILTGPLRSMDPRTVPALAGGFREELAWARGRPVAAFEADVRHLRRRWTDLYDQRLGRHSEWNLMTSLRSPKIWSEIEERAGVLRDRLLDLLERFWDRSFASVWADVGPLLEEEARTQSRSLLGLAPCEWLVGLSPRIHCRSAEGALLCHVPWGEEARLGQNFRVVASPSVFVWPHLFVTSDEEQALFTFQSRAVAAFASPVACPNRTRRALQALGEGSRLEVFRHLVGRSATTNALAHSLRITPSTVVRHLQQLSAAGLVRRRKEGHYVFYEADPQALQEVGEAISGMHREVHPALRRWLLRDIGKREGEGEGEPHGQADGSGSLG